MPRENTGSEQDGSVVDPSYSDGCYFKDTQRHSEDASFKVRNFLKLFFRVSEKTTVPVGSLTDVGCGSGVIIERIANGLRSRGFTATAFKAYDVSPHVQHIKKDGIEFIHGDFCESGDPSDVVTLFDVLEHVPDTIAFLKKLSSRCRIMALHIPLDDTWNYALRNRFRRRLKDPGHLLQLNTVSALNLLALAGLRVLDYEYTFSFLAPSGRKTLLQKLLFPLRCLLAAVSPWLLSRIFGGASLMIIAATPQNLQERTSVQPGA